MSTPQTFEVTGDDSYDAFLPIDWATGEWSLDARHDQVGWVMCRHLPAWSEGDGPSFVDLATIPQDVLVDLGVEAAQAGDFELVDTIDRLVQ